MGDTEQVQKSNTPIFPPVKGAAPVRRRRQIEADANAQIKEGENGEVPVKSGLPKSVRIILLLSLIPVMFYVPRVLAFAGDKVQKNQQLLYYLWAVYGSILLAIFFVIKRKTITLDSFATQIMAWLIFSLGIYHLVDLPKMVDMHLRKDVLYVWCSFTMIFNLGYFFIDNTDHLEEERKEKAKEEKRVKKEDEKKKKQAEKRKKKLDKMMSPRTRFIVNTLIYIGLVILLGLVVRWGYAYYLDLQLELETLQNPVPKRDFAAEERITDPVQGEDY